MRKSFLAFALACASLTALAHVPFLKPNQFNVLHERLQVESAFTEMPFQADFAMDSPHFSLTTPDGSSVALEGALKTRAAVYLEPLLQGGDGTYRVSTGVRQGPLYRAVQAERNGKLYFADDMAQTPGKAVTMQYFSRADVYVTKGEPAYQMRPAGQGVEIVPLASPNQLAPGKPLRLQVLRDGKPVPRARIVQGFGDEHYQRQRQADFYDPDNVREDNITADMQGIFTFRPGKAGLHYLFTNLHVQVAETEWESHNAALTLEVNPPHAHLHPHSHSHSHSHGKKSQRP